MFGFIGRAIKRNLEAYIVTFLLSIMLLYSIWPLGLLSFILILPTSALFASMVAGVVAQAYVAFIYPGLYISIKVPLIIIKILVFVLITMPLHALGHSSSWIWNTLHSSIDNLTEKKTDDEGNEKTRPKPLYIAIYLLTSIGMIYLIGVDLDSLRSLIQDATFIAILIASIPLLLVLITSALSVKKEKGSFTGGKKSFEHELDTPEVGQSKVREAKQAPGKAAKKAGKGTKKAGKGIYKGLQHVPDDAKKKAVKGAVKDAKYSKKGTGVKAAKTAAKGGLRGGFFSILKSVRSLPLVGGWLANILRSAGSGILAGAGGISLTTVGIVIVAIVVLLILLVILWIIIAIVFLAIFGAILTGIVFPFIGELFGPVVDLGFDYGEAGFAATPGVPEYDWTAERNALQLAGARARCALEGPQCIQEWQRNNTREPGAETVTDDFKIDITDLNVNSDNPWDISAHRIGDDLPVFFRIENEADGVYGIPAHDVEYQIEIDGGPGSCETDWNSIGGDFIEEEDTIRPGDFATPPSGETELTMAECGMMQPDSSSDYRAELNVRYNYSSQSIVTVDVMSDDLLREQGITPDQKESEATATPVQSFINLPDPVTFSNDIDNDPRPFTVLANFETDNYNTEYKIVSEDVEIWNSDLFVDVDTLEDEDLTCDDFEHVDGNLYTLDDSYVETLEQRQDQEWFSRGLNPTPAFCDMIVDPDQRPISETGETAQIRIDANYTTKTWRTETFEVENRRCTFSDDLNCPVVPAVGDDGLENFEGDISVSNTCSTSLGEGIGALGGCTVIEMSENWVRSPGIVNRNSILNKDIREGETAFMLEELRRMMMPYDEDSDSHRLIGRINNDGYRGAAAGLDLDPEKFDEDDFDFEGGIVHNDGGDARFIEGPVMSCDGDNSEIFEYLEEEFFEIGDPGDIILAAVQIDTECSVGDDQQPGESDDSGSPTDVGSGPGGL